MFVLKMDLELENVPYVVAVCIVLHNICELKKDNYLEEWTDSTSTGCFSNGFLAAEAQLPDLMQTVFMMLLCNISFDCNI